MDCTQFRDCLADFDVRASQDTAAFERHCSSCVECRELWKAVVLFDQVMTDRYADLVAPDSLRLPVRHLTLIPETLDFIGWAAIIGAISFTIGMWQPVVAVWTGSLIFVFAGCLLTLAAIGTLWVSPDRLS